MENPNSLMNEGEENQSASDDGFHSTTTNAMQYDGGSALCTANPIIHPSIHSFTLFAADFAVCFVRHGMAVEDVCG